MSWLLYFIYLLIFIFLIQKLSFFNAPHIERKWIVALFLLKVVSGILLFIIYQYYYPPTDSDIFHYFNDGLIIHSSFFEKPMPMRQTFSIIIHRVVIGLNHIITIYPTTI